MSKLQAFLEKAIKEKNRQDSAHLGDRAAYVGASDIAGCPRKAVLSKRTPKERDAKTLLRFTRGHVAENLMAGIFAAGGLKFDREVEVPHPDYPYIRGHIDFLFRSNRRLHVVELKTVSGIPAEPYASWIDQLQTQMGLLELVRPGIPIGGSILALDLNAGEWQEFNSFQPNRVVFELMIGKGRHIWAALNGTEEPKCERGLLCGYCSYRDDCPAMTAPIIDFPQEVAQLARLHLNASRLKAFAESDLKYLRGAVLEFTGSNFRGANHEMVIDASEVEPSETVDARLLKTRFPQIYQQVKKKKAGYTRLKIEPITTAAQ